MTSRNLTLEEQIVHEGAHTIAGFMMESVIGSGGVYAAHPTYMRGARALCDKYGIIYIADEVPPPPPPSASPPPSSSSRRHCRCCRRS